MTPIPTLNSTEMNALLRHDFVAFIQQSFYELNPEVEYLHNWHIELIAGELELCRRGETRRLVRIRL